MLLLSFSLKINKSIRHLKSNFCCHAKASMESKDSHSIRLVFAIKKTFWPFLASKTAAWARSNNGFPTDWALRLRKEAASFRKATTYLLSFRMATFSAEKSGLSRGSSDQHFVIILMISSSSAHSSSTIGLKGLLPDWLGRRTDSTISTEEVNKGLLDWKHIFSPTMAKKKTLKNSKFLKAFSGLIESEASNRQRLRIGCRTQLKC